MAQIEQPNLQNKEMLQNELIQKNCDALVWVSYMQEDKILTNMTFFRDDKKKPTVEPTDIGFKYNILLFRTPSDADEGPFLAIIGDPRGYAERMSKLGYHGIMYKHKLKPKKALKHLFEIILISLGFNRKQMKKAIKTTVV